MNFIPWIRLLNQATVSRMKLYLLAARLSVSDVTSHSVISLTTSQDQHLGDSVGQVTSLKASNMMSVIAHALSVCAADAGTT